jgi:MFS family permease
MRPSPFAAALAGCAALAVAMGVGRFAFTPILPLMQEDAGVAVAQGGWLASANYAGYLIGALSAAALPAFLPLSRTAIVRGGLAATGILTAAMGLSGNFTLWLALRFAAGVASAWVMVAVSSWCLERFAAAGRPTLSGTLYAGVGAGIALAGLACLALMHAGAGSANSWIALGILSLAVCAAVWPLFREQENAAAAQATKSSGERWPRNSALLVACYGIYGYGYIIPATFLPVMAKQEVPDPLLFGWAWPLFGTAAALSTLAVGALGSKGGYRLQWTLVQLVMAFGVVLPAFVPGFAAILLAALCIGGTFVVITMVGYQEARRIAPADPVPLMAAMTAAFAAGQVIGPLTVGLFSGFSSALIVAGALTAASALALLRA